MALYNNYIFKFFSKNSGHFMTTWNMHSSGVYYRSFVVVVVVMVVCK